MQWGCIFITHKGVSYVSPVIVQWSYTAAASDCLGTTVNSYGFIVL